MKNPTIDRNTIKMGSSSKSRYHQAAISQGAEKAKKGLMKWTEVTQSITENCSVYGLAHHYTHHVSTNGDIHENLVNDMEEFSETGYKQVLLGLRNPSGSGGGHAINLIFDKANGIYSIQDDNLGRVEFTSLAQLKKSARTYFKAFYPLHTDIEFECYKTATA